MNSRRYCPTSFDTADNTIPVSRLVMRTCAPTMAEPEGSVMVPVNVARASCAMEGATAIREITRRVSVLVRFNLSSGRFQKTPAFCARLYHRGEAIGFSKKLHKSPLQ